MTPLTPPATAAARPAAARPDWIEVAIQWASGAAAVAMFAYGVALSYAVLYAIAAAAGLPAWAAKLWPLGCEAFTASAALNALAEQRHRRHLAAGWRRVPWYPWTLTALTAGGSILLNWFHPAIPLDPPPGWLVSVVYGLPPLIAVFAWHLFLQRVAHRRHLTPAGTDTGTVPMPVPHQSGPVRQQGQDQDGDGEEAAGTAAGGVRGPSSPDVAAQPFRPPVPIPAGPARPSAAVARPAAGRAGALDAGLLAQARAAAAEHENTHGRPISRDALRQTLRVSNQTAGALLHQVRAHPTGPQPQDQDQDQDQGGGTAGTSTPGPANSSAPPDRAPVAGNGAGGGRPTGVAALVPGPVLGRDGQEGTGGA
jgi:Protein of unknown function (DUF2637)